MTVLKLSLIVAMISSLLPSFTWHHPQLGLTYSQAEAQAYKPPWRGAPKSRVGGGTRGPKDERPSLSALAPDHLGLTVSEQPELYWYLSKDSSHPVEFILNDKEGIDPLLEVVMKPPLQAGIHRIQLAQHQTRLQPGVPYQWFVALIIDAENPSLEVVAGGAIQYLAPSDERKEKVNSALNNATTPADTWRAYASGGIWYDALASLMTEMLKTPQNTALRQQRAALFSEVDLSEVPADAKQFP